MGRATAPVSQGHYNHPGCVLIVLLRPLATALAGSPRHHKRKCLCPWLAASGQWVDYSLPAKEAGPRRSHPDAWVWRSAQPLQGQEAGTEASLVVLQLLLL